MLAALERLFTRRADGALFPRWIFLRALGLIFFSAFYSLAYQIHALIGNSGILPASQYFTQLTRILPGLERFWAAPSVLWVSQSDTALTLVVWLGMLASLALTANLWPRAAIALCTLLFLSCIAALQVFSHYQSDTMLMEAGAAALFFAPRGLRPGLGASSPPTRASLFLLQWEWFRIYFESGVVKVASGDVQWRTLTAMDHYYETNPLPTWIAWYAHQLPHAFHAFEVLLTFAIELGVVWLLFFPRRYRIACFLVVTTLQVGIILTANYAFLNYIVLSLGFLLLDDRFFHRFKLKAPEAAEIALGKRWIPIAFAQAWLLYATVAAFLFGAAPALLTWPERAIAPLRIAGRYGLFAVMTEGRWEIEFQGSQDAQTWTPYPFRYKPQYVNVAPDIFAPYQPRFEWNLWFASLGTWEEDPWVVRTQSLLLKGEPSVLSLFARDPFAGVPPRYIRTVLFQYWFTDREERRRTGHVWRREFVRLYSGTLGRGEHGELVVVE
jgi:hypothetical protein